MKQLARYHRGDMYLPVDTYRRGEQDITLIGMIHVAPAEFYTQVGDLLDAYERRGDRILIEGMGRIEGDDHDLTEFDRTLLTGYQALRDRANLIYAQVTSATGTITQLAAFPHWKKWERADLSALELMRLRGLRSIPEIDEQVRAKFEELLAQPKTRHLLYRVLQLVPRVLSLLWPVQSMLGTVTLHHRNHVAVLKALESSRNAVLPWGAAHLPGMGKLLIQNGFTHESRTWLLAFPARELERKP